MQERLKRWPNSQVGEELIVKVLFVLQAPSTQFVRTLNEVPAKFVRTLAAVAESKSAA